MPGTRAHPAQNLLCVRIPVYSSITSFLSSSCVGHFSGSALFKFDPPNRLWTPGLCQGFNMLLQPLLLLPNCTKKKRRNIYYRLTVQGWVKKQRRTGSIRLRIQCECLHRSSQVDLATLSTFPLSSFISMLSIASWASVEDEKVTNPKPRCFGSGFRDYRKRRRKEGQLNQKQER